MSEESSGVFPRKGLLPVGFCWRDEGVIDSGAAGMIRAWSSISSSTSAPIQDQCLLFKPYFPLCPKGHGLRTGISGERGAGAGLGLDLGILKVFFNLNGSVI